MGTPWSPKAWKNIIEDIFGTNVICMSMFQSFKGHTFLSVLGISRFFVRITILAASTGTCSFSAGPEDHYSNTSTWRTGHPFNRKPRERYKSFTGIMWFTEMRSCVTSSSTKQRIE